MGLFPKMSSKGLRWWQAGGICVSSRPSWYTRDVQAWARRGDASTAKGLGMRTPGVRDGITGCKNSTCRTVVQLEEPRALATASGVSKRGKGRKKGEEDRSPITEGLECLARASP